MQSWSDKPGYRAELPKHTMLIFLYFVRTTALMKRQRCKQLWHYHWLKTDRGHTTAPSALWCSFLEVEAIIHPADTAELAWFTAPPQTVDSVHTCVWKHWSRLYLVIWRERWTVFSRSCDCIHMSYINLFVCFEQKPETCLFFNKFQSASLCSAHPQLHFTAAIRITWRAAFLEPMNGTYCWL